MKFNICKSEVPALFRERELNSSLFNISTTLNSALDFEKIMHAVLSEASQALCTEAAGIALRRSDRWIIRYGCGLTENILRQSFSDQEFPSAALAMDRKTPLTIENDSATGAGDAKKAAVRPVLVVPLVMKGTVTGCLFFERRIRAKPFDDAAIDFAERAGELISLGLENARVAKQYELLSEQTEGGSIGASTVAADISDRKRMEEALRESELKFRKIASSARDAIILIDNEGRVEFWNDAATKMFGFRDEDIRGKNLHLLIMPERYSADFVRGFEAFRSTGEGRFIGKTYEITAKRKDGSEFPVELSLAAMKLKNRWHAIGIVRDITDRKRAEADLKRTLEELERSNKELQQFAYVASHDLQEPLRTVSGFVELLRMKYKGKTLDEKADSYISFAVEGVHRMSTLINDLLDYSRVGTKGGRFEPVDMGGVLNQATGNLKTAIKESAAEITSEPLPVVTGDQTQLIQLLQNLIANAIKFRKKNVQPRIRISAERSGHEWVFGVHDNGIGIEPDYYEKIFVIFQRLHTRTEYPGTGVGLAICKRIVERHGGRIRAESKPGEGSSFYFSMPDKRE